MAQAISAGTSAPCLVCALLQLPRTSHHHPLTGRGTAHHSTNCSLKVPLPKSYTYAAEVNSHPFSYCFHQVLKPHELILLPTNHPESLQEPSPCELTPPAQEEGLVLCPRLPSQKHTNMCTQGIGNKKQSPALICTGSQETNPAGFASSSNCPANALGAPQPCTPENPRGDK